MSFLKVLAEFDIDVGCVVREQYPSQIDCPFLSDLMLPEGSHKYAEDWCFFTLRPRSDPEGDQKPPTDTTGLKYALNMVRNKRDNNVRRGAIVKAISVVTTRDSLDMLWAMKALIRDALEAPSLDSSLDRPLDPIPTTPLERTASTLIWLTLAVLCRRCV